MQPEEILKALELRQLGWSLKRIGQKFGRDHTSILFHCQKYGIVPDGEVIPATPTIKRSVKKTVKHKAPPPEVPAEPLVIESLADIVMKKDGKRNPGKSYREYLAEAKSRPKLPIRPWIKNFMQFEHVPVKARNPGHISINKRSRSVFASANLSEIDE